MLKEITITVDTDGTSEMKITGFEEESPQVAAAFEGAIGKAEKVNWKPGAHVHVINGKKVMHTH